jgi:transposase
MIRVYKYRIKDRRARKVLTAHAYAVNQVFNWAVAQQRDIQERYRAGAPKRKWLSHFDLAKSCAGVGADLGIHQQTVQAVCQQFAQSRNQHGCPRFRSSFGTKRALGWVPFQRQSRQIEGNSITYRGKRFRFWEGNRPVPEAAKGGAFVEDAQGRWYVIFHIEIEEAAVPSSGGEIGIDLGLKALATMSDGEVIENPRHLAQWGDRLAIAQRAGNKRRARAIHAKISNARKDFHHRLSRRLSRDYAFIAVGNVNAKNLAKTRMAKSVLDAGWSAFRNMLRYKAATFVEVDEKFTTQTCSSCGSLPPERPKGIAGLGIREWDCSLCGASHDRDVNAARNILALALGVERPVEGSRKTINRIGTIPPLTAREVMENRNSNGFNRPLSFLTRHRDHLITERAEK